MQMLVTSAPRANAEGFGSLCSFALDGTLSGLFRADSRVTDPCGPSVSADRQFLHVSTDSDRILALNAVGDVVRDTEEVPGVNAGGGNIGTNGKYPVGMRGARTIAAFAADLSGAPQNVLPAGIVPFPRGLASVEGGTIYLASGIGPGGEGENSIAAFDADGTHLASRFTTDDAVNSLDLAVAANEIILASSEFPFRVPDAIASVREYDRSSGSVVRALATPPSVRFHQPLGSRFGPDRLLYRAARDNVVVFDFGNDPFIDAAVHTPWLNGQTVVFFPSPAD
ncbi:hypothetical protein [Paraburkholderia sp. GAS334]|uniref:hypothetical protein n=1 Tax=Paraburkholderia sp. GAS334 TaxID=3035131 RepID=UPI003D1D2072